MVLVRATRTGYYDLIRRREGEEFYIKNEKELGKWMEPLHSHDDDDEEEEEHEEVEVAPKKKKKAKAHHEREAVAMSRVKEKDVAKPTGDTDVI